jgi:hypothetical protein
MFLSPLLASTVLHTWYLHVHKVCGTCCGSFYIQKHELFVGRKNVTRCLSLHREIKSEVLVITYWNYKLVVLNILLQWSLLQQNAVFLDFFHRIAITVFSTWVSLYCVCLWLWLENSAVGSSGFLESLSNCRIFESNGKFRYWCLVKSQQPKLYMWICFFLGGKFISNSLEFHFNFCSQLEPCRSCGGNCNGWSVFLGVESFMFLSFGANTILLWNVSSSLPKYIQDSKWFSIIALVLNFVPVHPKLNSWIAIGLVILQHANLNANFLFCN